MRATSVAALPAALTDADFPASKEALVFGEELGENRGS